MRKTIAASAVAVAAAGAALAVPALAATKTVAVKDNSFAPASLTIKKGTTVKWVWRGQSIHNVVGSGPARFSSKLQAKGTYSYRFAKAGTYKILCSVHAPGMKMTVKVK